MFNFNNVVKFENKRFDVFAIGELLVDMISDDYDADNSCNKYSRYFGGSPANITMNIKRLGGNPIISASVGNDRLGEFLINNLKKNNINTEFINKIKFYTCITEFAKCVTNSKVFASKLKECGTLIMKNNALEIGFKHFVTM